MYKVMQIVSGTWAQTQVFLAPLLLTTILPCLPVVSWHCFTESKARRNKHIGKVCELNPCHHQYLQSSAEETNLAKVSLLRSSTARIQSQNRDQSCAFSFLSCCLWTKFLEEGVCLSIAPDFKVKVEEEAQKFFLNVPEV